MENSQELNSNTGSYQTLCALASGGMGRVDLAVRKEGSFERLFAVKRLKAEFATDPEVRGMFLDEARIAGLVRHPNVVSVMDIGEDESGPFLVMQYVEGITVAALISEKSAQPIPMEVALKIVIHAAEGLHAAHELRGADGTPLQLVHRDVSPQNIMVGFDGVSLVTDFGIAKAMGRTSRTSTGVLKGKLGYLAPEQL
ncbi:MAG TPA: serine/threonine-protein kinase, partial [Polyangiaceae bacterium]|nr:serine/threonine-protein kinase [Polyangiaceae bacterium]